MSRYFGTDGMRGRAGTLLAPELAMRTGYGLAMELAPAAKRYARGKRPQVVVGHDTRLSADMLRLGLEKHLEFGDPDFPQFYSLSHETAKIGKTPSQFRRGA